MGRHLQPRWAWTYLRPKASLSWPRPLPCEYPDRRLTPASPGRPAVGRSWCQIQLTVTTAMQTDSLSRITMAWTTHYFRQIRAYQDLPGGPGGPFKWLAEGRTASWSVVAGGRRGGVAGSGPGGQVLARGRFYWASLRVARWVANWCVRGLLCVGPRCSPSVSLLVTLHSCWSVEVPALHGMREVSGSSPLSSTPGQTKLVSVRLVRGILRGKIHRTMAVWPAETQAWLSLPGEQRLCDL